jgi:hypothetical protein
MKNAQPITLPKLGFPTFTLPANARPSTKFGRTSIIVASAQLPIQTAVGDLNIAVNFWGELKQTADGNEYHVAASLPRDVSGANAETRDAVLAHVEMAAMKHWPLWNGAYDAGHAALTGKKLTARPVLGRVEPKTAAPKLVKQPGRTVEPQTAPAAADGAN